jgi:uncharacterized LabA/DUF88 family protein
MEKYYINFYTDEDNSKVKGNWKLTEKEAEEEKDSYLYKVKLRLRWRQMAAIEKTKVEEMAKEHNMSIAEVLGCV